MQYFAVQHRRSPAGGERLVQAALRRLAGKVAVIAGGAGDIGTATSRRLAAEGASVMVGDLNLDAAASVAQAINDAGGSATSCCVDLGNLESISQLFNNAVSSFGGVDLLHCNAATTGGTPGDCDALDVSVGTWNAVLNVNLTGYFHCTRAALPLMLARGGGAIIYTSSGAAFSGEATRVAYGVSKAGLHALARHVALRWGKHASRANAVPLVWC